MHQDLQTQRIHIQGQMNIHHAHRTRNNAGLHTHRAGGQQHNNSIRERTIETRTRLGHLRTTAKTPATTNTERNHNNTLATQHRRRRGKYAQTDRDTDTDADTDTHTRTARHVDHRPGQPLCLLLMLLDTNHCVCVCGVCRCEQENKRQGDRDKDRETDRETYRL